MGRGFEPRPAYPLEQAKFTEGENFGALFLHFGCALSVSFGVACAESDLYEARRITVLSDPSDELRAMLLTGWSR